METSKISVTLKCRKCGGRTIVLPDKPTNASIAVCESCGTEVGRWGDIKAAARKVAKKQVAKGVKKFEKDLRDAFSGIDGIKFK